MKIDITAQKQMEFVQTVLFEISDAANKSDKLDELLKIIHHALGTLMDTSNFYIALYDEDAEEYSFPYSVDKYDLDEFSKEEMKKSLTDYVRRTGTPLWVDKKKHDELIALGEVDKVGEHAAIWIGAPLYTPKRVIGVVALQNYEDPETYTPKDMEVLAHVSGHIASAIERKINEKVISNTMSLMRSIVESTADGILVVDNDGKVVYANQRFSKMWRIPDVILKTFNEEKMLSHVLSQLKHPDQFITKVKKLYKSSDEDFDMLYCIDSKNDL
jgi:PAS domain-containing protein